ncbi:T9SS type A sorting domain-containing protein [Bacteroidota bacterium]
MKKLAIVLILTSLFFSDVIAKENNNKNNIQRRSLLTETSDFGPWQSSYPYPFVGTGEPIENPKGNAAISTGYYFVFSGDLRAEPPLRPVYSFIDTTEDVDNWYRILSGPRQKPMSYWEQHPELGYGYFRNPSLFSDSTDNAIAGPIPIGFKFMFNGIEYDSFYVSTNGCIALSNTRYHYDGNGNKTEKENNYGNPNAYNSMSADWFRRGQRFKDWELDEMPDNFGWLCVTGGESAGQYGGIRNPDIRPDEITELTGAAIIAPFYGDGYLAQWDGKENKPIDEGKVFYYRDEENDKLIIYYINFRLEDTLKTPFGNYNVPNPENLSQTDNGYISANVQIVLNKSDSSITFVYERFSGSVRVSNITYNAKDVFRYNTHCGVFGFARHQSYNSKKAEDNPYYKGTLPWAEEYQQYTYAWSKYLELSGLAYPDNYHAIKFKQWKNTLRAVDLAFRVRLQVEGSSDFTEEVLTSEAQDFEILAGHDQVGQLQPVAIVQNLSNDIQGPDGVNYQPQDLNFRVRLAIINQVSRRPLYNRYVQVDSSAIAEKSNDDVAYQKVILSKVSYSEGDYTADTMHTDYYDNDNHLKTKYNGIPSYDFVQVYFPPFEPNKLYLSNIGLFKAFVMVDPTDTRTGERFGDMWSFDDTLSVRFHVMRRIGPDETFFDDVREFHVINDDNGSLVAIPSVFKWVNMGAEVVDGDMVSEYPLAPRGEFYCENDRVFPEYKLNSPVIKMDRQENVGIQEWGGTEIRSFPIDLSYKWSVLTLSVQRSTKRDDWERGWSDGQIVGCEHRVVVNDWYNVEQEPDELRIEFARASPDWRSGTGITNIPEENWRYHLRRNGAPTETNMSAYSIFGGGGYMVGFLESDPDSSLSPPVYHPYSARAENGLRYDYYDDGIDFEYKHIYIPIPDTFINTGNEGAKYFRFRIKEYAKNNQRTEASIPDDEDPFYVDNIWILNAQDEDVDIEVKKVSIEWPYTVVPASQATSIPITVQLSNNTGKTSPSIWLKTISVPREFFDEAYYLDNEWIYEGSPEDDDYDEMVEEFAWRNQQSRDSARRELMRIRFISCRIKPIPFIRPGATVTVTLPGLNARIAPPGEYVLISTAYVPGWGGDMIPRNDTNYCFYSMRFGPYISYHPIINDSNLRQAQSNVSQMTGEYGRGLTLQGYHKGGIENYLKEWEVGDPGGDGGPGEIAVKFELFQEDTLYGYGGYYHAKSRIPDYFQYRLYSGDDIPENEIPNSQVYTRRGDDDLLDSNLFDHIVYKLLPKKIVLPRGTYWVSINQPGETGLEFGASKTGCGMRCVKLYNHNLPDEELNGSKANYLNIEDAYREKNKFGELVNKNLFAYRNGDGEWVQFMPDEGNPGYGHLLHTGVSPVDGVTQTYSRGTWLPLLVPYLGDRKYNPLYEFRYDDWCGWPVELSSFTGYSRNGANDLIWETASEIDNYGFFIERRIEGKEKEWSTLPGFVNGNGTTNIAQEYFYTDKDVEPDITYLYRLRQVDLDGTQTADDFSGIVTLTYSDKGSIVLEQNSPNPFTSGTEIRFSLPRKTLITLDILDIYGNIVITLIDEELSAGQHSSIWNAVDRNGNKVSTGTYFYRLKAGDKILTGKMALIN